MNNWKLRSTITGQDGMDFVEVNGHLASFDNTGDTLVEIVPFGDKFAAPIRTTVSDVFGPVSNQVPGICNGTFTHTGAASGNVASTTLTGEGSGAFFNYTFLADGTLSTITANTTGSNYKVGDKLRITTSSSHGSQVIEFRLVDGSNARSYAIRLVHDQGVLPYAVHKVRITETDDHTIQVLDYRSSQVFPRPQDKLLDKYPDAAAAFGLRKLRSAYLGPCIRVQRSSDNALVDIGFKGDSIDLQALQDFVGEYDGRVRTWYDQSGNGNNAEQTGTSQRPNIIIGGVLQTVNDKPAMTFDGIDDKFSLNHSDLYGQSRLDVYMHLQSTDNKFVLLKGDGSFKHDGIAEDGGMSTTVFRNFGSPQIYVNGVDIDMTYGTTTRDLYHKALITDGASHSNGAILVQQGANSNVSSAEWTEFTLSGYGGAMFAGKITESVFYNTDQSANRENIEKDMALYSGAYQVEDAPLLDAYGGAHAAYSLRKLNSDYTGAAIRVRANRTGSPEQDIGFNADGTLDTAALFAFVGDTNGNIKTWYDQSGNGNHVTQGTNASQPQIVSGLNTIRQVDGRPAASFNGNDAFPFDNTGLDIGNLSSFIVCKYSNTSGDQQALTLSGTSGDARWFAPRVVGGNFNYTVGTSGAVGTASANTANNLHTCIAGATQTDTEAFLNGTSVGTKALGSGIDSNLANIGSRGTSAYMNGFIQEVVVYSSDQSERRLGIERNISNHYDL